MGGRLKLGQLLVSKGLIGPEQLAAALGEQEKWGHRLGMTLVRMGCLEEEALMRVLATQLRLPVARIQGKNVNPEVLELVPAELAEKYRCLPLFLREEGGRRLLFLGMEDPSDLDAVDELSFQVGQKLRPVLVSPSELDAAIARHYRAGAGRTDPATGLPPLPPLGHQKPRAAASAPAPATVAAPIAPETPPPRAADPDTETAPSVAPPMDPMLDPLLAGGSPFAAPGRPAADEEVDTDPFGGIDPDLSLSPLGPSPDLSLAGADLDTPDPGVTLGGEPRFGPPEPGPAPAKRTGGVAADAILKALAQLLVEKGVITREEFAERLRRINTR